MQTTRESSRQKRCNKRRNSRKKSLSPSDLKCTRGDAKTDSKLNGKRSLSEGSVKVKHRKSNIRRTLTHPFTCTESDDIRDVSMIGVFNRSVKVDPPPESDESNLPPTSSDRDTEDDGRLSRPAPQRSRWDSGSEMDSLVSTVVRRASARRRRTPANPEWGVNCEPGEASEPEAGRMRPEDYRLVFLSSDSSCREDTEDSSSTASSAAPPAPDDCDWDYFEPGASAAHPIPPPAKHAPQACPRPCSCGAEPRIVAVPVPVPVPVPAALWPALLAFPTQTPPTPHWNTYPGLAPLDAATLARFTTAAAVAVTAAATASASASAAAPQTVKLEMTTVERTDKAIQFEASQAPEPRDNDNNDKDIERPVENEPSVGIKVIAEEDSLSLSSDPANAMPDHLEAEKAFPSSNESADSSDSEQVAQRSYDLTSGAPEEPATSDEDSDDSGGGGGRFSRVFVVNPADSSSDLEDNADSSGIDCDDSYDKKSDSLEIIAVDVAGQNEANVSAESNESFSPRSENSNIVLLDSVNFTEEYSVIPYENNSDDDSNHEGSRKSNFFNFCDKNMLQSETCERFNSFNASCSSSSSNDLDKKNNTDSDVNRYQSISSENTDYDSLADVKVKFSVELANETHYNNELNSAEIQPDSLTKLAPSPEPSHDNTTSSTSAEKIDLFKGIERTLSELLKKELMEDQEEEKMHSGRPVCADAEGSACAPAATTVCRSRTACADGSARFTSRVMITHDRVSVVTSDTTRLMREVIVHHTNSQSESDPNPDVQQDETDERISDDETPQPSGGVTVVSNADTLSAVVCLEEGLADDDSWVEDVSHNEDEATSPSDTDSGDEASLPMRGEDFAYCRRSIDFTLHTIVEESCEESETEQTTKKPRPISATELEKYFFFGLGDGRNVRDDEEAVSETSSVCSEGGESIVDNEQPKRSGDNDDLVSSRLEKYFLSGFMGFNQERRDSDGSGSVGSDSEGRQSPEQRRKRLVRARGTPRSHSNSLDNLLTGDEPSQDNQEVSDASSTETEDRHDSSERLDMQGETKRKKQNKKPRGSPADERRQSAEFTEETRDDTRSVSEGEDGRLSPRPEFPPLGSELSESKKQTSRDSGFVGSCDDLLRNGDSSSDFTRSHEPKIELEEIIEEIRPDIEERVEVPPSSRPPQSPLVRKDSFNNWSSDEETNLMMTKMRQFFKTMIHTTNVRTSTPASSNSTESSRPPKPPQLLYFESELTRLMKTVPGIRDEEVREIVEYLSSEDTWSDSYDSSDYAGSDLEGTTAGTRSALRKQISDSCREIIDEFDRGNNDAGSLERDAVGAYRRLAATLGRAGEGSPPMFGKVMRHIGGRLVALMHEVSGGASPSTDDDSASEPGALARSRSHDILEPTASRGSVASDCERFSWRGSFESALLAADSRGTLGGGGESRRSPAGADLAAQKSHSRSCGAIGGSEDRLWRGRRRASAPDAESEEEQRAGSLPRLPSITGTNTVPAGPVKSARYRAPGFRTATRAASAPGLHAPRRRRPPPTPLQPPPAAPASAPSLQARAAIDAGRPLKKPEAGHRGRTEEARACLNKAKLDLGNSRNLKAEIKTAVLGAINRLYELVKESERDKAPVAPIPAPDPVLTADRISPHPIPVEVLAGQTELLNRLKEHISELRDNSEKLERLQHSLASKESAGETTYANVAAVNKGHTGAHTLERTTLHSVVVSSTQEMETGDEILERVRKAVDAKEGWVRIEKVRKAKDRKIIMGCATQEERRKVKERLEAAGGNLVVEEVKNRDPLLILRDVLKIHSDEEVVKALKNQNREIFHGLDDEDQRTAIKYRRNTRNPHMNHVVLSVSPMIWRRAIDAGKLRIDLQRVRVEDQTPLVQCTRCLGYGHGKRLCKEPADLCSHCGGSHIRADCPNRQTGEAAACINCTRSKLGNTGHNAFSSDCPVRKRWDGLARASIAYC